MGHSNWNHFNNGRKKGKGPVKERIKAPWTKTVGGIECGRWGVGRAGESKGENGDNCN